MAFGGLLSVWYPSGQSWDTGAVLSCPRCLGHAWDTAFLLEPEVAGQFLRNS